MAGPFQKRGVWYGRIKNRLSQWVTPKLAPTPQNKRHAHVINRDLQSIEDDYRTGRRVTPKENTDATFAALVEWYLERRLKGKPSYAAKAPTMRRHLIDWEAPVDPDHPEWVDLPLGPRLPAEVTADRLTNFLKYKVDAGELAAATANGVRAWIRAAFNAAIAAKRFHGDNPVSAEGVKPHMEPKRKPLYLEPEWIAKILDNVLERYRGIFATGIYLGLRKGEIFALQKGDVDLDKGLLYVRRSHEREIPKSGHEEGLPIPRELAPYLRQAIEASPCELVFPSPTTGERYHRRYDLVKVLRSVLKRIRFGLLGYHMKCRRTGKQAASGERCGYVSELTQDYTVRPCPRCRYKLWPAPQVEPFRFHDTRHTTGSLLTMFGANPKAVQKLMRHRNLASTEIYAHLAPGFLRKEADMLSFRPATAPQDESQPDVLVATVALGFATPLLPGGETGPSRRSVEGRKGAEESLVTVEREKGLEPSTSTLARWPPPLAGSQQTSQVAANSGTGDASADEGSQPDATAGQGFATRLLPGLRVHDGGRASRLLTVREVARRLSVAQATVYRLVATGALPHVRILGAIRVSPVDLTAYIAASRRGR